MAAVAERRHRRGLDHLCGRRRGDAIDFAERQKFDGIDPALALPVPAFAEYLRIPDPKAGSKHWEIGTSGPGYLWPPRQLDPGQQLARMMMANPDVFAERFLAHEAAAGVYLDEGVRRALEDNQRQIAEAEQRQREREEREAAEARKAQEAERAAYYAKHGWPT